MKVRTETIQETKTKRIRVTDKNREKMRRAFNITITDNQTGKVLVKEDTNIVLGVYNATSKAKEDATAIGAISVANCDRITRLCAIKALESVKEENIKRLLGDTLSDLLED